MKKEKAIFVVILAVITIFTTGIIGTREKEKNVNTEARLVNTTSSLSNVKIGWGIKRENNHMQPDLGSKNKKIMDEYKGYAMGNNEYKYVYLTFDEGYEAGYTPKILEVLKQNDVNATFFITAHYLNTNEELVRKMIEDGHIVGNHF